jgi:hypothetical protein
MTATLSRETYNGWANYETWNVALWLQNDEVLYNIARRYDDYDQFANCIRLFYSETPDGVSYTDDALDLDELDEMMQDL